CLQYNSAPYSF
nr:immunoglobulin light chain junction region [Macaca mulatta]MOV65272.1 immunoglobulin light chain junction region [Macaca mulatta]MOW51777.1 immunoglobulin light chain junction region [Macaca mulatta]MOW52532.1 immunoglobulin light chain junction region [Macaca mulatta]MOW53730.1 immunoglobulin light chain junction region [Macaca mulatta]